MSNYGTIAANGSTFTLSPTIGERPPKTPSGLMATAAVQTRDGWLGQVIVDKEIVFESPAFSNVDSAIDAANGVVVEAIKRLFKGIEIEV